MATTTRTRSGVYRQVEQSEVALLTLKLKP
jgi:hypothetical protein